MSQIIIFGRLGILQKSVTDNGSGWMALPCEDSKISVHDTERI